MASTSLWQVFPSMVVRRSVLELDTGRRKCAKCLALYGRLTTRRTLHLLRFVASATLGMHRLTPLTCLPVSKASSLFSRLFVQLAHCL